ncbi:MAG TPA: undecaprenyldiphospho-muramoylpentapeptide beta-N-acetylglucosaminyltransferase [Solirubrobacteraceae bacterium]|jgi:UDP-N-acetylglucosamine--N-acetylmuramyl-(pentapeptide) pyrophosphoryl-undecaprenol N-acetylglucosamine transferase|nr:undecaprenyldiphospho-muramoylpentapeptide beta-N-acetylglucosaminyltransferase [Solirubrobacteraceae bacterium]
MSSQPKIVIAAGGTAGHVVPALAVAAALRADGAEVAFVGAGRAEAELVPAAGYELHAISVEGLHRRNPLLALRALALAALAVPRSRRLLKRLAPDAVMGGGGYVAGPVALAALTLRIPVVLTEADSHLGLTNRMLAPFARRVCLAFPIAGRDGERYQVTGRPVPPTARDADGARERLGIGAAETCVLVFGGSLGARTINRAAAQAFGGSAFRVLHIAGSREYAELAARELPPGYELREYLDEADFADALAAADLAVSRAGGSLFEIAAHGLPAILVPYPHAAADHQSTNARWMADAGAAVVIADSELSSERLARQVAELLADRSRLSAMSAASRALARPDAAQQVAHALLDAAGR